MAIILNNVEDIIIAILEKSNTIDTMDKYDGITVEATIKNRRSFKTAKEEIVNICIELNLNPISIEQNEDNKKKFALQFPELNVLYTNDQRQTLYNNLFKWLLDNASQRNTVSSQPITITKALLTKSKDVYVKNAIIMYCKSNINPYKDKVDNYLNNAEYRKIVDTIYYNYLDTYCTENNIH